MVAMKKAFLAVEGNDAIHADRIQKTVEQLTQQISERFMRRSVVEGVIHIESIQDQVELALMRAGEQKVARAYVLYREARHQERLAQTIKMPSLIDSITVTLADGHTVPLDRQWLQRLIERACLGIPDVSAQPIFDDVQKNLFNGVGIKDIYKALALSARTLVETEPNYSLVTARLLLEDIYEETSQALGVIRNKDFSHIHAWYAECFKAFIAQGITAELLHANLQDFDLDRLGQALKIQNVIRTSTIWVCKLCMTVTLSTAGAIASNCRKHFLCGWRWDWRIAKVNSAMKKPLNFIICCLHLIL